MCIKKVGIIVDGQAEFFSLSQIYKRIDTKNQLLSLKKADLQPGAPVKKNAKRARSALTLLARKGAKRVIVLLDFEDASGCPGKRKNALEDAVSAVGHAVGISEVFVVYKNRMYENWLVSDTQALKALPGRFSIKNADTSNIEPNKADNCDAMCILKSAAQTEDYSKVSDAARIMELLDPYRAAKNSRSFRRFLRVVGCAKYQKGSLHP